MSFNAVVVKKTKDKSFDVSYESLRDSFLKSNDLKIAVNYSSLNYKDILSCKGNLAITRKFPHIPGIDAAGIVIESSVPEFSYGDRVIVSSFDQGMNSFGGFSELLTAPSISAVRISDHLSFYNAMAIGVAGYTAFLGIKELQKEKVFPSSGEILISGASGGVGSIAAFFLCKLGYDVVAVTSKADSFDYLKNLGVKEVLLNEDFVCKTDRNLLTEKYAGAIDSLGGEMLSTILRNLNSKGLAIAIGNVASSSLSVSLLPFLLRGIKLIGLNADLNADMRRDVWEEIADLIKHEDLRKISNEITLDKFPQLFKERKRDGVSAIGRTVIRISENFA